jgi:hypothetical protein
MGPSDCNVPPERRGQGYVNVYWRKSPFKVIPPYRTDVNNHTRRTGLEVASPSAQCSQLQCAARWRPVRGLNFERLDLPLSSLCQGTFVDFRGSTVVRALEGSGDYVGVRNCPRGGVEVKVMRLKFLLVTSAAFESSCSVSLIVVRENHLALAPLGKRNVTTLLSSFGNRKSYPYRLHSERCHGR